MHEIFDKTVKKKELKRLQNFVQGVIDQYKEDDEDPYVGLIQRAWATPRREKIFGPAQARLVLGAEVRPKQPLTSCLDGAVGSEIIKYNQEKSDVITFHQYESGQLLENIANLEKLERPLICTEYMARELGTTFEFSLPIFRDKKIGCYNWGLVAGKSQTHFPRSSVKHLQRLKKEKAFIEDHEDIPEPEVWFHDIFRKMALRMIKTK